MKIPSKNCLKIWILTGARCLGEDDIDTLGEELLNKIIAMASGQKTWSENGNNGSFRFGLPGNCLYNKGVLWDY